MWLLHKGLVYCLYNYIFVSGESTAYVVISADMVQRSVNKMFDVNMTAALNTSYVACLHHICTKSIIYTFYTSITNEILQNIRFSRTKKV